MRRVTVLFILFTAGCGPSNAPPVKPGAEGPANDKPQAVVNEPKHDYQGWKKYAPSEAAFQVLFPKEPVVKTPSPATGNFYVVGVQRQALDDVGYICQWTIKEKAPNKEYLKDQQMGALNSSRGKLVEESDITLDGVPGREFIIELPDKNVSRWRSYVAGNRVISVQVQGKDVESVRSGDAVMFLDSLNIN